MLKKFAAVLILFIVAGVLVACGGSANNAAAPENQSGDSAAAGSKSVNLILGAYTTPREAYGEIIPLFKAQWQEKTGQEVTFEESYQGSGAQSRAIAEGFEADVTALSLEADITRLEKAGLITHDWRSVGTKGMVSTSIVVFGVRKGNPLGIKDWADLAKPGVEVLTPNPKTSGGAMWNILALYGAAKRGFVEGVSKDDEAAAQAFLLAVLKNVKVMDKGARESITNYEQGVGQVIITYENEILVGQQGGQDYEMVIPRSTILIENPVAIVDTYVDKHGSREAAEAFVKFLFTREAQEIFARHGLRSIDSDVAKSTAAQYPPVEDLFTIEYFGGWGKATPDFFGDTGVYNQVISGVQGLPQ
ncbi:MAG: sulfate ABC transporter substrate-binding protein [Anaerolineales bacterium]|nr:sulfate ABC transporter substrate-binding protein [Anaerolineales bacterium]